MMRVAMWSGPRNISTAMMRAWENRPDTVVVDEPFYAHYLARLDGSRGDHPARDEVLAAQPADADAVVAGLLEPLPDGVNVRYVKHMTHHLFDDDDLGWTVGGFRNVLLIRTPDEVVASYLRSRDTCEPEDIGILQQERLLDVLEAAGERSPVIDAADFLRDPGVLPGVVVQLARDRLHRADARVARRAARQRRRVGPALVRRGVGVHGVRALPASRRPPGRPGRGGRGDLPAGVRAHARRPTDPLRTRSST
jgi:hypothetical protein